MQKRENRPPRPQARRGGGFFASRVAFPRLCARQSDRKSFSGVVYKEYNGKNRAFGGYQEDVMKTRIEVYQEDAIITHFPDTARALRDRIQGGSHA